MVRGYLLGLLTAVVIVYAAACELKVVSRPARSVNSLEIGGHQVEFNLVTVPGCPGDGASYEFCFGTTLEGGITSAPMRLCTK